MKPWTGSWPIRTLALDQGDAHLEFDLDALGRGVLRKEGRGDPVRVYRARDLVELRIRERRGGTWSCWFHFDASAGTLAADGYDNLEQNR